MVKGLPTALPDAVEAQPPHCYKGLCAGCCSLGILLMTHLHAHRQIESHLGEPRLLQLHLAYHWSRGQADTLILSMESCPEMLSSALAFDRSRLLFTSQPVAHFLDLDLGHTNLLSFVGLWPGA